MINNSVSNLHIVKDEPRKALVMRGRQYDYEGPVSVTTTYINNTIHPVTIVTRSGMRFCVPPVQDPSSVPNTFIIRTRVVVKGSNWPQFNQLMNACATDDNPYVQLMAETAEAHKTINSQNPFHFNDRMIVIDHLIDSNKLSRNRNSYNRNQDVVISTEDPVLASPHPFSDNAAIPFSLPNTEETDMASNMAVQMELIQGDEPLQIRYVSFAGKVLPIYPKKDLRRQPGVYMTHLERDASSPRPGAVKAVSKRYDIDEIEEALGIYKTPEQAVEAADAKAGQKVMLADLEHQIAETKRRTELDRANLEASVQAFREKELRLKQEVLDAQTRAEEADRVKLTIQREHEAERKTLEEYYERRLRESEARLREERDRLELGAQRRKDYYDERSTVRKDDYDRKSTERKDSSELLKFAPALLLGVGVLFAAVVKFFF